jgi:hypothetical protein
VPKTWRGRLQASSAPGATLANKGPNSKNLQASACKLPHHGGSWAGETDLVKVVMYATAILAAELRGAIVAEREACAKIAEEWWNSPDGAVVDIDLDQFPVPAAIRART